MEVRTGIIILGSLFIRYEEIAPQLPSQLFSFQIGYILINLRCYAIFQSLREARYFCSADAKNVRVLFSFLLEGQSSSSLCSIFLMVRPGFFRRRLWIYLKPESKLTDKTYLLLYARIASSISYDDVIVDNRDVSISDHLLSSLPVPSSKSYITT